MSKLYAAALILGAFAGTALLASVGCSEAHDEETGVALGAVGEDAGDGGVARGQLVISAVYPFGGRTGAQFTNDYVEILNKTSKEITLDGLSIQLSATATGTFATPVALKGKVGGGKYFLVALGSGGAAGDPLPDPDQTAAADAPQIGESTTGNVKLAGKVALAIGTGPLNCGQNGSSCSTTKVLDLVGWGSTSAWEGSSSARAFTDDASEAEKRSLARPGDSCADSDNNGKDFALATPAPRNAGTAAVNCNPPKPDAGVDANSIPKPINEPKPGEETPFDAGFRPEAGAGSSSGGPGEDDGCAVSATGVGGLASFTPLAAIVLGLGLAMRRRRRD